jgi:hypothetical protein
MVANRTDRCTCCLDRGDCGLHGGAGTGSAVSRATRFKIAQSAHHPRLCVLSQRNRVRPSARHCRRNQPRGRALHWAKHGNSEHGHGIHGHGSWQRYFDWFCSSTSNGRLRCFTGLGGQVSSLARSAVSGMRVNLTPSGVFKNALCGQAVS